MQQVAAISMKVMVLCFVSHKVMTTPISCVCFGLVTTNTTLLVTLPSCGGWRGDYMLIYTHCWELMNSVGSHGSSSLLFVMKVMVCHFVSDSHEVMTALIVVLPLIVVVEISLQLHRASCGGGRGGVSLCNQLSVVCISELVPFYMALY